MLNRTTVKTSTIFVAEGTATKIFRSMEEMPADTRRRMEKCMNGSHAATILIADRRGRDEIARAMDGLPSDFQSKVAEKVSSRRRAAERETRLEETVRRLVFSKYARVAVPVAIGLAVWLLLQIR
jgi:hypothetical protein